MSCQYRGLAFVVGVNAYTQANKLSTVVLLESISKLAEQ